MASECMLDTTQRAII